MTDDYGSSGYDIIAALVLAALFVVAPIVAPLGRVAAFLFASAGLFLLLFVGALLAAVTRNFRG